jgi:hypothetical protein
MLAVIPGSINMEIIESSVGERNIVYLRQGEKVRE